MCQWPQYTEERAVKTQLRKMRKIFESLFSETTVADMNNEEYIQELITGKVNKDSLYTLKLLIQLCDMGMVYNAKLLRFAVMRDRFFDRFSVKEYTTVISSTRYDELFSHNELPEGTSLVFLDTSSVVMKKSEEQKILDSIVETIVLDHNYTILGRKQKINNICYIAKNLCKDKSVQDITRADICTFFKSQTRKIKYSMIFDFLVFYNQRTGVNEDVAPILKYYREIPALSISKYFDELLTTNDFSLFFVVKKKVYKTDLPQNCPLFQDLLDFLSQETYRDSSEESKFVETIYLATGRKALAATKGS